MALREKLKKAKKEIFSKEDLIFDSDGNALITIKADRNEQIYSEYDYDCNDKLNEELASYIWDKAKFVPAKNDIRIKVYAGDGIDKREVANAIHGKFKKEYLEVKNERKQNLLFSFAMFVLGLLSLAVLFLSYAFFRNDYVDIIVEIVAWVFMWEAVDAFFLQRTQLRRKQITLLKLCACNVEVFKAKTKKVAKSQDQKAN